MSVTPIKKDHRSELAIKRDEWLDSVEGSACCDYATIVSLTGGAGYLRNRIEAAFLAGAMATHEIAEDLSDKVKD